MDLSAPSPRTRTGRLRTVAAVAAALLVAVVLLRLPLPAYVLRPGPVIPLADKISLDGVDPINGDYLFTTIQLDDATMLSALAAAVDAEAQVIAQRAILGDLEEAAFVAEQEGLFAEAEALATRLALDLAGSDLPPSAVTIAGEGVVGGPSAGLMMTLAIADLLLPEDLADGRRIAGTGAVTDDGRVEDVGSIADKIDAAEAAGADLFVLPRGLADAARATGTDLPLLPVSTAAEALAAVSQG